MAGKGRKLRKYTYRGKALDELCEMKLENLGELFRSRVRRKLKRSGGLRGKYLKLLEKIKKSKMNLAPGERPKVIKTHLRNCVILPQMVGGELAVYNGKEYKEFTIKFDMIGKYMGEFSITYNPTLRKAAFAQKKKDK